jgi:hypothetical protein
VIKRDEVVDRLFHERMALGGEHQVVANANWDGLGENDRILEEWVEWTHTPHVKIHVYAAIIVQDEIADSVRTLYWVGISVESGKEPRILLRNELP